MPRLGEGPRGERARSIRRSRSIHAYTGPNGGGKTWAMLFDTIPSIEAGRTILSTVPMSHPSYVPLTSYSQLLDAEHCDVLLDEIAAVASSRESTNLPAPVVNLFQQLRKRDVVVRFTAPAFARADKVLRETCQAVTFCKSYAPKWDPERSWPMRRLFWLRTYDAVMFDDFTAKRSESLRSMTRAWIWRPGHAVDDLYDTLAPVSYMGIATESGTCVTCGGRRLRPKCSCPEGAGHPQGAPAPRMAGALDIDPFGGSEDIAGGAGFRDGADAPF